VFDIQGQLDCMKIEPIRSVLISSKHRLQVGVGARIELQPNFWVAPHDYSRSLRGTSEVP